MKIPWPQKCSCGHTMASHNSLGCTANVLRDAHRIANTGLVEGTEHPCSCEVRNTSE